MIDLILRNGVIISMNPQREILKRASVAVDKGKIIAVGDACEIEHKYRAKKEIDCEDHVIMPGFVDAHGHAGHSAFRFIVNRTKYWMPAMTHTYKHYVRDTFWYTEGRVSALERLKSGVTTGVSVLGSQPRCDSPVFARNHAQAYAEVGVRNIVCTGPCHTPWPHRFSRWSEDGKRKMREVSFEETVKSLEEVIKTVNNTNNGKSFAYVTPFTIVTSINPSGATPLNQLTRLTDHDKLQANEMRRVAKEFNTRIHSDCFGGMLTLLMEDMQYALIGSNVHLQHCSELSVEEIKILADSGTSVGVCPGSGAPVDAMLDIGLNMAITSDGTKLGYGFDMFGCMRQFQQVYRNRANDDALIPDAKALEMVTIDAAKAVGLDHMVGSIEVGKEADLIAVNLFSAKLTPNFNLLFSLVSNASAADIDHVIVAGETLMENRLTTLNEKEILLSAQREAEWTVERANLSHMARLDENLWGRIRIPNREEPYDLAWQREDGGHY